MYVHTVCTDAVFTIVNEVLTNLECCATGDTDSGVCTAKYLLTKGKYEVG